MSSSSSFPSLFFFFFFFLLLLLLLDLLVLLHLGLPLPLLLCLLFFFDLQPSKRASDTTLEKLSTNVLYLSLSVCCDDSVGRRIDGGSRGRLCSSLC